MGGKIVTLVVLDGSDEELAKDIAMQAAAMRPLYINVESVPEEDLEHEKAVIKEQVINEGKKPEFADKIVDNESRFVLYGRRLIPKFANIPDLKVWKLRIKMLQSFP